MIARIWKGAVKLADADEYAGHIRRTGFGGASTVTHYQVVDRVEPPGPAAGGNG